VSRGVLAPGLIVLGALAVAVPLWRADLDDALIIYRYARHLAQGMGWQYNPGETFNAVTSPLYTLVLGALGALGLDIRAAAHAVSLVAATATGVLVHALLRGAVAPAAGLVAGLLVVVNPLLVATTGLETPLALALATLAVWSADRRPGWPTGLVLGLAILTRGDAGLLAVLLWGRRLWRTRRVPLAEVAACLLVLAPWILYAATTFGAVLPHTLAAKRAQGASGLWGRGWLMLYEGPGVVLTFSRSWWVLAPLLGLAVAGAWRLPGSPRALLLYGLGLTAAYTGLNVPAYHWYFAPLMLGLCVAAGAGIPWLLAVAPGRRWRVGVAGAVSALLAMQVVAAYVCCGPHQAYRDLGGWLRAATPPGASVAAAEIGHLGWYSERPIVDMVGLVSPGVAARLRVGDAGWWLQAYRPDYLVFHEPPWAVEAAAMRTPAFRAYELVTRRAYPDYGTYTIWRRSGGASASRRRATRVAATGTRWSRSRGSEVARSQDRS
jgi:hypothetical protein